MDEENRIISSKEKNSDKTWDLALRPKNFLEYIGQEKVKNNLQISIKAAAKRKEPIEHVLLYGPPGLGKTTLAHVIAKESGVNLRITSGPAIEKGGDLAAILTNITENDILFIDEIHRLNKSIEEILYPAMEDYALDIIMGKGPSARVLRLDLPRFTIIGATTKISSLSAPLRDRFGLIHHLNYYENSDIQRIIKRSANLLGVDIDEDSSLEIAKRARRTPRIANRLLKRVRDYCQVEDKEKIDKDYCQKSFDMLEIDKLGLDWIDRKILEVIVTKFGGGPVGLNTLSAATGEEMSTIEDVYEPYLMQLGFIERSPRGRVVTKEGYKHLGLELKDQQNILS